MDRKRFPAFEDPLKARPIDGEVAITGPAHMHGSMTPEAADASADQLRAVAQAARDQIARKTPP